MSYDREKPFEHQHFRLEQYFAVGKFVKIMLIGKPQIQKGFDDKHYLALSYVGITAHKCRDQLIDQNIQKELASFAQVLNALQKNLSNDLVLMGEALLAHSEQLLLEPLPDVFIQTLNGIGKLGFEFSFVPTEFFRFLVMILDKFCERNIEFTPEYSIPFERVMDHVQHLIDLESMEQINKLLDQRLGKGDFPSNELENAYEYLHAVYRKDRL